MCCEWAYLGSHNRLTQRFSSHRLRLCACVNGKNTLEHRRVDTKGSRIDSDTRKQVPPVIETLPKLHESCQNEIAMLVGA